MLRGCTYCCKAAEPLCKLAEPICKAAIPSCEPAASIAMLQHLSASLQNDSAPAQDTPARLPPRSSPCTALLPDCSPHLQAPRSIPHRRRTILHARKINLRPRKSSPQPRKNPSKQIIYAIPATRAAKIPCRFPQPRNILLTKPPATTTWPSAIYLRRYPFQRD